MKPQILKFTYTKSNGEVSEREVVTVQEPSKLLMVLDISDEELTTEDLEDILYELEEINKARLESLYALAEYYNLRKAIKTFKPENISNKENITAKVMKGTKYGLG